MIDWPALAPTQGKPVQLIPGLIIIDDFFSKATLKRWTAFLNAPDTPIKLESSPPAKTGEALRTNSRFQIDDANFADSLWTETALRELVAEDERFKSKFKGRKPAGLNSNIRIYRYDKGNQFKKHYDDDTVDPITGTKSEWTILIYLTGVEDGVKAGETIFYPAGKSAVSVDLLRGRAVLHKHGRECMPHEGARVKEGQKWILRTDLMFA